MNDKRDLNMSVSDTIEWCGRYGSLNSEMELTNWEIYIGDRIVAYNYDVENGYIVKYAATGYFPLKYKLCVVFSHIKGKYKLTKKYV